MRNSPVNRSRWLFFILLLTSLEIILFPATSHAYIGPGAGLSAIGAFLALVAAVVVAIVGFIWYPFKRIFRKRKQAQDLKRVDDNPTPAREDQQK